MAASSLRLHPCFADLDAFVPRVMKLGVASTSAVSEPRTTATTTTAFPRFPDGPALAAYGHDGRRRSRRGCWYFLCGHSSTKRNRTTLSSLCCLAMELTFACLHAFRPLVINVFAAEASAVLEPSTGRSAATDSA